jgi:hypothetical protein
MQHPRCGKIGALRVINGQTINRIVDDNGFTPVATNPAHQHILYGQPAVDLTTDDLVYRLLRRSTPNRVPGTWLKTANRIGWLKF